MAKKGIISKARYLRKEETNAEKILWQKLKNYGLGIKFRRQHPIDAFIVDFYSPTLGLAIELDGSTHKASKDYDQMRTRYLNSKNILVMRFWNSEIEQDLEKVLNKVREEIKKLLSASPLSIH